MSSLRRLQLKMPNNASVYIVRCADGSLYTGWTNNLPERLAAHNSGDGARYTRGRRPVELVYYETCSDRSQALRREYEIKKMDRKQKELLIAIMQEKL
jgi:putative endonuclease